MSDDFEEDSEPPADDSEEEILASLGEFDILNSLGIYWTAEIHLEDLKKTLTQYASDRNFQATHPHQ
jgi:hypothetical protein